MHHSWMWKEGKVRWSLYIYKSPMKLIAPNLYKNVSWSQLSFNLTVTIFPSIAQQRLQAVSEGQRLTTVLQGAEELQVSNRAGKGRWCNRLERWRCKSRTQFCKLHWLSEVNNLCLCLLLRMKAVWWVVRIFLVSTAFTKQSNKDVCFPITALRPNHQTAWLA